MNNRLLFGQEDCINKKTAEGWIPGRFFIFIHIKKGCYDFFIS